MASITASLRDVGDLSADELAYIAETCGLFALEYEVENCAERLRELTRTRATWEALYSAVEMYEDGRVVEANKALQTVSQGVSDMSRKDRLEARSLRSLFTEFEERVQDCVLGERTVHYSTGYKHLDELVMLFPQELYIVGARPGMGKTAFGLCLAQSLSLRRGLSGLFVSCEMSKEQIVSRLISMKTQFRGKKIREGTIYEQDVPQISGAIELLRDQDLDISEACRSTADIRSLIRRRKATGKPYAYCVVDYVQLLKGEDTRKQKEERVADVSRDLKLISKEENLPVIALAQVNREVSKSGDKRPRLEHLRDSGAIEQDADVVVLLHRESYYSDEATKVMDEEGVAAWETELIVAKHRHGQMGTVKVGFRPESTTFTNLKETSRSW